MSALLSEDDNFMDTCNLDEIEVDSWRRIKEQYRAVYRSSTAVIHESVREVQQRLSQHVHVFAIQGLFALQNLVYVVGA